MTADAPAPHTPDPATAAPAHAENKRREAGRIEGWSIAWMLLALTLWGGFVFLMLADYGPDYQGRAMCRGPLVGPSTRDAACRDDALRQWPALLGILALAAVATVTAAATTVYAKVLSRLVPGDGPGVRPRD
ncbi:MULTISPECIES: hypothetical protein [unclassified Streptomyces]|uniref:hypothetical protein n=1 Tax=unclassified Streptomyces TaxID=2593676 RepID=UPI003250F6F8